MIFFAPAARWKIVFLECLPLEINVFVVISARRRLETTWFSSIIRLKNYIWHNPKQYFLAAESSWNFWEIRDYRSDDLLLRPVPKGLTVGFKDFVAPRTDQLDWPPVRTNIPCILGRVIRYPIFVTACSFLDDPAAQKCHILNCVSPLEQCSHPEISAIIIIILKVSGRRRRSEPKRRGDKLEGGSIEVILSLSFL